MGEPLFDGVSAAIVVSGAVAIIVLRSAEAANLDRSRQLSLIGHLLLGVSVSLLLYRWVDAVTSLPPEARPNVWRSGALAVACGIGLVAAVKSVIDPTVIGRFKHLTAAVGCAESALLLAAEWQWALLLQVLWLGGFALAKWFSPRAGHEKMADECDRHHEPALVLFASSALLLLLLGTWQHVVEHETQRKTRSPRYSAWPRATALRDAWERTGWTVKPQPSDDAGLSNTPPREQHVALGLGALLLLFVTASRYQPEPKIADSEADHAG